MSELARVQVLDVGEQTLPELAASANAYHQVAQDAARSAVESAIAAGHVLLKAKEMLGPTKWGDGKWASWLEANFVGSHETAVRWMRLARNQHLIPEGISIQHAEAMLPVLRPANGWTPDSDVVAAVKKLRSEGWTYARIAGELGINQKTAWRYVNAQSVKQRHQRASRALDIQEQQLEIKRAVRKAGAATAEAWSMAERMQDVLAQAHREATDKEARVALSLAGEHYRKMRDEIVRALGVA